MNNPFDKNGWIKIETIRLEIGSRASKYVDFEAITRKDGSWDYPYYRIVLIGEEKWIEVTGPNDYSEPWLHFIVPLNRVNFIEPPVPEGMTEESDYWQR